MSLKQTRAKNIRLRIVDPALSRLEHFSKIVGLDIEDYLVGVGIEYPELIAKFTLLKEEKECQQKICEKGTSTEDLSV